MPKILQCSIKPVGPGPAGYNLPPTLGYDKSDLRKDRLPQYSFGRRTEFNPKIIGPGPAGYKLEHINRFGKPNSPRFTFLERTRLIDKRVSPGPAAHHLEICPEFKGQRAPKWGFGRRINYSIKNINPAPNTYSYAVRLTKPGVPAFSLLGKIPELKTWRSPGPATYGRSDLNKVKNQNPVFSLGQRTKQILPKSIAPIATPNINIQNYSPDRGHTYSFGVRHGQFKAPMIVPCDN